MPLSAVNFITKGPVLHADLLQFFNLFTGVMVDQPVTFSNVLAIGGNQGATTVPLKLYGAVGQTTHLLDLYPDRTSAQPGFGFSAIGNFGWGPGGDAPIDTSLSRIGTQFGTADMAGLSIVPRLRMGGDLDMFGSIVFPSGSAIADGGAGVVNLGTHAAVQSLLYVGFDHGQYLNEVGPGLMGIQPTLLIHGANAAASGLTYANAHLQVRGDDMADVAGTFAMGFSAYTFATNWLQFNPKFYKVTAGTGWPGIALLLDYDVDASVSAGGRISMVNGRVGVGAQLANPNGDLFQTMGAATIGGGLTVHGNTQIDNSLNVDLITIDSAANSGNAKLAFPQSATPKISLYDNGAGDFWGFGINSGELYTVIHNPGSWSIRAGSPSGLQYLLYTLTTIGSDPNVAMLQTQHGGLFIGPGIASADLPNITLYTPNDPQGQGQAFRVITPSTRPASQVGGGEVHIGIRLFCDGDITSGTNMHAVSFMTTSDPRLKSNMTLMPDDMCMARIRAPSVPVYSYTITPPVTGGYPSPTQPDMGFDANDVYRNSPEFAALDSTGTPTAVVYGQMASLLWGALRNLDARCQAKGI
ncbi:MAG TPA: hypothetical protein VLL82_13550 [Mycobacterium sp.]|nr:hypothetical protein [Mycobacterium sp.]